MIAQTDFAILLIEDNELDARSMIKGLAADPHARFEVTRAKDLADAASRLESGPFDCVLLDLSLPDSEGLASLGWLTARFPDHPVVVLTGLDDPTTAMEAVHQGAQDYLSKQSARPETISRSIRYAVARMHSELALRSATDQLTLLNDRERIARDLHDTVIQQLFATGIGLQSVLRSIPDDTARARVEGAVADIDGAIHQLREAIFGLHTVPSEVQLGQAIAALAAEKVEALGFEPVVEVGSLPDDLPEPLWHEAIQVVNEGLSNVIKHALATTTIIEVRVDAGVEVGVGDAAEIGIGVEAEVEDRYLVVTVTDNGVGTPAVPRAPAEEHDTMTGQGLNNMAGRAADLNGRFHIGPGPGGGTRIDWRVPLRGG